MKFNVNNKVRVKLTPLGRSIHHASHMKLYERYPPNSKPEYRAPEEDAEGWSTWQLWELMHEFGINLHNAIGLENIPFEPEIEIIEEDQDV